MNVYLKTLAAGGFALALSQTASASTQVQFGVYARRRPTRTAGRAHAAAVCGGAGVLRGAGRLRLRRAAWRGGMTGVRAAKHSCGARSRCAAKSGA